MFLKFSETFRFRSECCIPEKGNILGNSVLVKIDKNVFSFGCFLKYHVSLHTNQWQCPFDLLPWQLEQLTVNQADHWLHLSLCAPCSFWYLNTGHPRNLQETSYKGITLMLVSNCNRGYENNCFINYRWEGMSERDRCHTENTSRCSQQRN